MGALTTDRSAAVIRVERPGVPVAAAPSRTWRTTRPRMCAHEAAHHRPAAHHDGPGDDPRRAGLAVACGSCSRPSSAARSLPVAPTPSTATSTATSTRSCTHAVARPLPLGMIEPRAALVFALVLEVVAFALLWSTSNLLAASLAIAATAFYVFVYTLWLKRTHAAEHRHRRRRRRLPAARRLGRGHGSLSWRGRHPLRHRLLLDAAALLGAVDQVQRRLRARQRPDAARRRHRCGRRRTRSSGTPSRSFPVSLLLLATGSVSWIYGVSAGLLGGAFVYADVGVAPGADARAPRWASSRPRSTTWR